MKGIKMYQAKSSVISFWRREGGGKRSKFKVVQNGFKHILVLEFLKSEEFF